MEGFLIVPEISVILPVYNGESYLDATLQSIKAQSFSDFEVICVNDGSTDHSLDILEKIALGDERFSVVSQTNAGPGAARNTGLNLAKGNYVIMLDADDIYDNSLLEKLHESAERCNSDVVVCRSSQFDNTDGTPIDSWWTINIAQIPPKEVFAAEEMRDFVFSAFIGWPWDKLYRRAFIEKHGIRFPTLPNSEDLFFVFLSLALASRISIVDTPLINHRANRSESVSGSRAKAPLAFYESTCLLKAELKKHSDLYEKVSWGFLNWALGYLVWNIETMDDAQGRQVQLDALANDQFPELEIGLHSPAFFALDPQAYGKYCHFLDEALNGDQTDSDETPIQRHRVIPKLIKFLEGIQYEGIIRTVSKSLEWIKRKILRQAVSKPSPQLKRGSDYALTAHTAKLNKLSQQQGDR